MNPYTLRRLQYESTKAKLLEREFWDELSDDIRVSADLVKALATTLSQAAREGEFA